MSNNSIVPNILSASVLDFPGGVAAYNKTVALTVVAVAEQLMVQNAYDPDQALKEANTFMSLAEKYVREFKGVHQDSDLVSAK